MKKKASSFSTAKYKNMMYTQQMEHLPFRTREELEERIKTKLALKNMQSVKYMTKTLMKTEIPLKNIFMLCCVFKMHVH